MYVHDALATLARNFADPGVGAVVGESTYSQDSQAQAGADKDESLYWRYEIMIKRLESALGSTVGGDGAIYAIRKSLYRPMRADALSDFVNPLQIVQAGFRCIYEPQARSIENAAGDFEREFRRKVRIVNRAWRAMWTLKDLLNPLRYGLFSLQIFLAQAAALAGAGVPGRVPGRERRDRRSSLVLRGGAGDCSWRFTGWPRSATCCDVGAVCRASSPCRTISSW